MSILAQGTDQALALLPAGKLLLLFVAFFLAAHWGYLLLELDVTVAILAQGTDQALALLPASFSQIAAALLSSSLQRTGLLLAGARCHRSHFGSRYRSGLGFAAGLFSANCCCFLLSSSVQRTGATSCWS